MCCSLALEHEHIVGVREMVVGSSMDRVYMVMEYFEQVWGARSRCVTG